jgi:hypothetical protein
MNTFKLSILSILLVSAQHGLAIPTPFLSVHSLGVLTISHSETLSKAEADGLIFMREEEKLARDVYTNLSKKWRSRPFGNIAQSEQSHMDAVLALLKKYGVKVTSEKLGPGKFENTDLQKLFDQLVERGQKSRKDALEVGALVEETDIADLLKRRNGTEKADILATYNQLLFASGNHIRAFSRNLKGAGAVYKPTVLSPSQYNKIIGGADPASLK